MKLDVTCMRYLTKEDYRVLEAVEVGMKNHELVSIELISSLAKLRHGGIHKFLSNLLKFKLLAHSNQEYNGYRLSYLGFDILALRTLLLRGVISSVGSQIGVGKESDIFEALDDNGNEIVIKIHRLGRTSFRSVRKNRDYMQGKHKSSWLYMSKLAAIKEYAFMKALHAHGFPTPVPIDQSRHVIAMSRVPGFPMCQIKSGQMEHAEKIFLACTQILKRLAQHGLIHCDFNEFNLMVDENEIVTLIDFPQMVSVNHPNAAELFQRDMNGLVKFFAMKMKYIPPDDLVFDLEDIVDRTLCLDEEVRASGFSRAQENELSKYIFSSSRDTYDAEDVDDEDEVVDDDNDVVPELIPVEETEVALQAKDRQIEQDREENSDSASDNDSNSGNQAADDSDEEEDEHGVVESGPLDADSIFRVKDAVKR